MLPVRALTLVGVVLLGACASSAALDRGTDASVDLPVADAGADVPTVFDAGIDAPSVFDAPVDVPYVFDVGALLGPPPSCDLTGRWFQASSWLADGGGRTFREYPIDLVARDGRIDGTVFATRAAGTHQGAEVHIQVFYSWNTHYDGTVDPGCNVVTGSYYSTKPSGGFYWARACAFEGVPCDRDR